MKKRFRKLAAAVTACAMVLTACAGIAAAEEKEGEITGSYLAEYDMMDVFNAELEEAGIQHVAGGLDDEPFGNLPVYACLCVRTSPVYKDTSHTKPEPT